MNKYLMIGIAAFSLTATTVYAINDNSSNNSSVNDKVEYNQNCPHQNENKDCPYYDETNTTSHCPNSENGNCQHNHGGNGKGYGRHGRCSRHNQ